MLPNTISSNDLNEPHRQSNIVLRPLNACTLLLIRMLTSPFNNRLLSTSTSRQRYTLSHTLNLGNYTNALKSRQGHTKRPSKLAIRIRQRLYIPHSLAINYNPNLYLIRQGNITRRTLRRAKGLHKRSPLITSPNTIASFLSLNHSIRQPTLHTLISSRLLINRRYRSNIEIDIMKLSLVSTYDRERSPTMQQES